jgi:hypothetical protein
MIPLEFLQDGIVTLVAVAAAAVISRRMFGFVRPAATPGCAKCPSVSGACATETPREAAAAPLHLYRPAQSLQSLEGTDFSR